jgi:hypothetical protein
VPRSLFALCDFTIAQNEKAHAEKNGQAPLPGSKATRCLQNIFIVVLSNHYATSLGRDCNNNFLSMAISAAICPDCIQLSAQRMVIREDRKAPGVLRHAPWLGARLTLYLVTRSVSRYCKVH